MFNLLPDNLKNQIKSDYKKRRLTTVFVVVILLQISLILSLLPSWIVSYVKEKNILLETETSANSQFGKDADMVVSTIESVNEKLNLVSSVLQSPNPKDFLDRIIASKTNAIHINKFVYTTNNNKTDASISIEGVSLTRETLITFVKVLQDSKVFKTVDLPISNLAKDKDISFSIMLTIKT